MTHKIFPRLIILLVGFLFFSVIFLWALYEPNEDLVYWEPNMDGAPENLRSGQVSGGGIKIGEHFMAYTGRPSNLEAEWPRFRGSHFDNIVQSGIILNEDWDKQPPEKLWEISLGEGHAGAAVKYGRVYVLDYDEERKSDTLRCFSLDDGREIWRRWYYVPIKRNHGISRTIPAISDSVVVTMGPACHVMAVDAIKGDLLWGLDLTEKYGTQVPLWYTAQCPLIDVKTVVLAPGAEALMLGLDLHSGEVLWEVPNPGQWKMSHSSIILAKIHGELFYLYASLGGFTGVWARGPNTGQVAFQTAEWNYAVIAPSPVPLENGLIFITAGYGAGGGFLEVTKNDNSYDISLISSHLPSEGLASEQQTPILWDNHLFAVLPKDGGEDRSQFVCYTLDNKKVYSSGKDYQFGLGPLLLVNDRLLVLADDGVLNLVGAQTDKFELITQAKVLHGRDAWAPMALAGNRLILRDSSQMICLKIGE